MMKTRTRSILTFVLLLGAPLLGGVLRGLPDGFFSFPPLVHHDPIHAPFSWPVWGLFAVAAFLFALLLLFPHRFGFQRGASPPRVEKHPFPSWGYAGLVLNLVMWVVAWSGLREPAWLTLHTFFPIWLGYILVVDGLVFRFTGTSMVAHRRSFFLKLFPASAVAWWYFEYTNRFIQNWWYLDAEFSPLHYVVNATFCFSTVLPAVFETRDLLLAQPWFRTKYEQGPRLKNFHSRFSRIVMLAAGIVCLILMAAFPDPFFYMVWLGPLLIVYAMLLRNGHAYPLGNLVEGRYRNLVALAVAALVCGFFWEMWNFLSTPKWVYDVPYVTRFRVFEMPIVGYAGYLPFGPFCWCAWLLLRDAFGHDEQATA